ncbi:unnamed protein product [Urochloa humidicola]
MVIAGAAAAPCRPRSARYAEKGYPNYADPDERSAPRWRDDGGGGRRAKKPEVRRGRKRDSGEAAEVAVVGKIQPPILQVEEAAVAQEQGRKRRMTDAAASATAAGKAFPLIEDGVEEEEVVVASTDGGADERGVRKSCRLRVKETLRVFSSTYLHCVQEEQKRAESVRQDLKASRLLKRQGHNSQVNGSYQEAKSPCKRPDLKALTKECFY